MYTWVRSNQTFIPQKPSSRTLRLSLRVS